MTETFTIVMSAGTIVIAIVGAYYTARIKTESTVAVLKERTESIQRSLEQHRLEARQDMRELTRKVEAMNRRPQFPDDDA